jgi:hypothetical protein
MDSQKTATTRGEEANEEMGTGRKGKESPSGLCGLALSCFVLCFSLFLSLEHLPLLLGSQSSLLLDGRLFISNATDRCAW